MENESDVAIVGMAGRFPGARNLDRFWSNLVRGVESIARLTDSEIAAAGVPAEVLARADYVRAAPVLDDPALFDAAFFGYSPGEAAALDPQQRLLLELAQVALEDAACDPGRFPGRIGVFAGSAMNTYFFHRGLEERWAENYLPTLIAHDKDFLATRISYKLGLRGPSLTVQSACSTSLVAVHLARQSLLNEETDLALAGAVSVRVPHRAGYFYDGSGVVSPDGHVRAFDAGANGTVFGSGAGVVVLKRLAQALADGDRIHAVLKGSAVNNDGSEKAGYTAPSVRGQAEVVVEALANAGVPADEISFLEAHGSGTPVGDRIEVRALTEAFRRFTPRQGYCALGSVKTNVGHLDAAAGMAGLIKTVLALKHRRIPPTLHFARANDEIDFPATPFFVNAQALEWNPPGGVRRAGVMATGIGGTNAHLVLEEAPAPAPAPVSPGPHLLLLSARTASALHAASGNLADFLESVPPADDAALPEVARTLQTGRRVFAHRRFTVCERRDEAVAALRAPAAAAAAATAACSAPLPPVVFLLPGVGDHYVGMGQGLYERFPVFRREIDRCAELLRPLLGLDLRELLFPRDRPPPPRARGIDLQRMLGGRADDPADPAAERLNRTIHAQPALFAVEYALAQLWIDWGIRPARLAGHSLGEYVAACLAGVLTLPDALRLVAVRARLADGLPPATMIAVMVAEDELLGWLGGGLSIALVNGPQLCVVAGPAAAMEEFKATLQRREVIFRPVRNAHAFHSRLLDPIVEPFAREVGQVRLAPPRIPFLSNVTGTWITPEQATDPRYWVEHARRTARFGDGLEALWKLPEAAFVEVGPGRTLGVLAMQHPARPAGAKPLIVSSLRHGYEQHPDAPLLLTSAGRLWLGGAEFDWKQVNPGGAPRRLSPPTYPFEPVRHWLEAKGTPAPAAPVSGGAAAQTDLADWFYVPSWTRADLAAAPADGGSPPLWLVLADSPRAARPVTALLEQRGCVVALACFGQAFAFREKFWEIRPACLDDYLQLLAALKGRWRAGLNLVHLGALGALGQEGGFHSLWSLAQAIGEQPTEGPVRLGVVTCQVQDVIGGEARHPAMATVTGLGAVLAKEYPSLAGSFSADLPAGPSGEPALQAWAGALLDEFRPGAKNGVIAYRGNHRWVRSFRRQSLPAQAPALRSGGVYLITGGTGGLGLAVAKYLADSCQARLLLTKKNPFPPKTEWKERLAAGTLPEAERRVVAALLEMEAAGADVEVFVCDAADREGMRRLVADTLARHGRIDGAIHAAGILRDGVVQLQTREAAEAILRPKVEGAAILADLLREAKPDFLALFSSLSSVVPLHGQGAYCAANAFLDALAGSARALGGCRTVAINWPAWREVGLLTSMKALAGLERRQAELRRDAILTRDGLESFRRALAANVSQVVVSPRELDALAAESREPLLAPAEPAGAAPAVSGGRRLDPPRDEVEKAVAAIWSAVLGIAPLGVHENFLDLGGHSLLAMRIVSQLRAAYQSHFTLRNFFANPTIAGVALALQSELLAEIESLSEAEAMPSAS